MKNNSITQIEKEIGGQIDASSVMDDTNLSNLYQRIMNKGGLSPTKSKEEEFKKLDTPKNTHQ